MKVFVVVIALMGASAWADKAKLEDQLNSLEVTNQAPAAVTKEKLYAVQERYLPLAYKSEITVGSGWNMSGDSFVSTSQIEAGYRFHFNDRLSLGGHYAWVDNRWTAAGNNLKATQGAVPDVPYARSRADLLLEWHPFYGKFRWTADTVSYFDQYMAMGPGVVGSLNSTDAAAVGDIGFVFWLGRHASFRFGLKDYVYEEHYRSGAALTSNLHAHLDLGVVF